MDGPDIVELAVKDAAAAYMVDDGWGTAAVGSIVWLYLVVAEAAAFS